MSIRLFFRLGVLSFELDACLQTEGGRYGS